MNHASKKYFLHKQVSRKNPFTKGRTEEKLLEAIMGNTGTNNYDPDVVFWVTLGTIKNIQKYRNTELQILLMIPWTYKTGMTLL